MSTNEPRPDTVVTPVGTSGRLASERVVVAAPMSYAGGTARIWLRAFVDEVEAEREAPSTEPELDNARILLCAMPEADCP